MIGYSYHLASLSKEIVQEQSRATLSQLLSPFFDSIIGLLGGTSQMRKPSITILREILEWAPNERSILDDLVQDSTSIDQIAQSLKNARQSEQRVSFFSTEHSKKVDIARVKYNDFIKSDKLLTNLKNTKLPSEVDQILRSHISYKSSYVKPADNQTPTDGLIMTKTTRENILKILEVLDDPIPILLEGSTGVGKSACIMEAANQSNRTLLRLNMSSRVTIDDLLGKVTLGSDPAKPFEFVEGQFTQAFSLGYWILLDELNLAQDTVLQAIESALDTRRLILRNLSSVEESLKNYKMHENFRLFATQNPNTGFFKGKREKLSPSFLSRFRPIIFTELPESEWCDIVQERLLSYFQGEAKLLAEYMVNNFNRRLKKKFNSSEKSSLEIGPYAEITIRELLKWVDLLIWEKTKGSGSLDLMGQNSWLSFSAWCVYGARYRDSGRVLVENALNDDGRDASGDSGLKEKIRFIVDPQRKRIGFDNVFCSAPINIQIFNPQKEWDRIYASIELDPVPPFDAIIWDSALKAHTAVHKAVIDSQFIEQHGIYRISILWLWEWLINAARTNRIQQRNKFALDGCHMYQSRFRHRQAHENIRNCFSQVYPDIKFTVPKIEQHSVHSEIPYVLTDRILATLKQVCFNLHIKQPILITGAEGCGKSELLLTLAWFCGQTVQQLNITPETEPSALIGQMIPNDHKNNENVNDRKKLIWENGCVTKAFIEGQWVLLDNLNVAESSVLERLNPILEHKPMLILTENSDNRQQVMHENYQLVATMTSPDTRRQPSQTSINELSPALYNRFGIVHMPDVSFDTEDKSEELSKNIRALLSDEFNPDDYTLAMDFCHTILKFYKKNPQNFPKLTLRSIIRLLDSAYLLRLKFSSELDFISSLWTAYHVTIANQIKDDQIRNDLTDRIRQLLQADRPAPNLRQPTLTDWIENNDNYILTPSRQNYANAVLGAVTCNIPLLLEGPAAVGKTALISDLCKHLEPGKVNPSSTTRIELERVNNTDTTTIQDYLGTYLPMNDTFIFQKGALYRAMENGWWFLADEFNLADPSVMNMLFPLLEGKRTIAIPSTGKIITAKPGFQFFATQNDASYANRHQLPISLRNRFLEVQFKEFPKQELPDIIDRRKQIGKQRPPCMNWNSSEKLAQFYHRVIGSRLGITFRELVKWIHRHALLSPNTESWLAIGVSLLGAKYALESEMRKELIKTLASVWGESQISPASAIRQIGIGVRFTEGNLSVDMKNMKLDESIVAKSPTSFQRSLVRLALAVHAKEPVLLVGPTSCKTLLVETWAHLTNRSTELIKVHLTPDTEAGDLIGEIQPCSFLELLTRLPIMGECVCLRFETLCRQKTDTGTLSNADQAFLKPLRDLITRKLPKLIVYFEKNYLQEEERRIKEDERYDNMSALLAETRAMQIPATIKVIDNASKIIDQRYVRQSSVYLDQYDEQFDSSCMPSDLNTVGDCVRINDGLGDGEREVNLTLDDAGVMSSDPIDDGFGSLSSLPQSHSASASNITDNVDDGLGEIPVTTSTFAHNTQTDISSSDVQEETAFDDGLGEIPVTTSTFAQNVQTNLTGSNMQAAGLFGDGLSTTIKTTFSILGSNLSSTSESGPIHQIKYPPEIVSTIDEICVEFDAMFQQLQYASSVNEDKTIRDYHGKFIKAWRDLTANNFDRTKPIFLFNDGPVTMAAKRGGILFLEDLDLPSQAVIERLNPMLEPSPKFALTEDITSQAGKGQLDIALSNDFQVFASVHQDQIHQVLKLSPATRSRFTEIHVESYSEEDLRKLIMNEFEKHNISGTQVDFLVKTMFSLRQKLRTDPEWKIAVDIRLLFRWTDFIVTHHQGISLEHRMFLGARFFYFDQLPLIRHGVLFDEWLNSLSHNNNYREYEHIFKPPDISHGALSFKPPSPSSNNSDEDKEQFPFEIGDDYVALRYTGVRCLCTFNQSEEKSKHINDIRVRFDSVPTRTLLNQMARIFAATSSKNPLLLEGPPGIGKTHVVIQVCSLLNRECERINLSANTSLDQLIGCIIPRIINGVRIFQWQEGRLLSAIAAKRWILLDELNLASSEVLEGLTPLFYRGVTQYKVPNTDRVVDLKDVLIFATMNPSTIGGGRNKLPRSISNLFTIVKLDEYSEDELRVILIGKFSQALSGNKINMSQLDEIFDLHTSIKVLVRDGKLGRTGGPYEFNLRDLTKFRDVFTGSIDTQLSHYQYINTIDDDDEKNVVDKPTTASPNNENKFISEIHASNARLLAIRKFAQVVYACQFQGQADFNQACENIDRKFEINPVLSKRENDCSIDTGVASVVRIGSIYISTGSQLPSPTDCGLIHTQKTIRQLELLAAACQSTRAVLLEGDICSRKTSLVMELARLTRRHVSVIALHENFETSDLIGSWLPKKNLSQEHPVFEKIDKMFTQITKILLLLVLPVMPEDDKKDFLEFKEILRHLKLTVGVARFDMIPKELEALKRIMTLLDKISRIPQMPNEVKIHLSCYIRQSGYFTEKLKELQENKTNQTQEMGFEFVESELVKAIREGWWILLDNINSAPPEVLERLNSLMEEKPMLSLYENSDGKVLRKRDKKLLNKDDGEVSSKDDEIHENFRLFTTANLNRIYSNRLSSAFLNRVIRLWLPSIDDDDPKHVANSDLYELLSTQLVKIPAGKQLAHLLVLTHMNVKEFVKKNQLVYPNDFNITYRLLEQCVQTLLSLVKHQVHPIDACYWSILRCYCSSLQNHSQYRFFVEQLQQTIKDSNLCLPSTIFSSASDELDQQQPIWNQESQPIRSAFVQLERFLIELIFTLINIVAQDKTLIKSTRELLILFIDNLLLLMKTDNTKLIQTRQNLSNDDHEHIDLISILKSLAEEQQLTILIDASQTRIVLQRIEELLKNGSSWLNSTSDQITVSLQNFITNTSFKDNGERFDFLQRVVTIAETFERFLNAPIFSNFDRTISISQFSFQLIQILRPILKFKEKYRAFELFQDTAFIEIKEEFQKYIYKNLNDDSLIWSFERAQSHPIRSSCRDLRILIKYILNDVKRQSIIGPIQHFASILEWISLQWRFDDYLISNVRHALQNNVGLNRDFILECQLKFSCWELINELTKMIKDIVFDLPSESNPVNTEYCRIENELKSKGIDPRNHQESQSYAGKTGIQKLISDWNRYERDRATLLSKAIAARTKLNENLNKLLNSEAYQFVRNRLEQSDSKQLNIFCQLLNEARRNLSLMNADGILDIHAVLGTSFGRTWIEHDYLLESPLTFFLCGYYFLPNYNNRIRIEVISDWKQLEQEIDVRNYRSTDLLFFCPNKQNYECCLVSIENQSRSVLIHLWSLQGDIIINKLSNILRQILPKGLDHQIDQQILPSVDGCVSENNPQTFALACLIHLGQQSDTITSWTSEIYSQTKLIFNQLERFIQQNTQEFQPTLMSIYQNLHQFRQKLDALDMSNTSSDSWEANIQQMWTLLKPYQNRFSAITVANVEQQLKYSIQSVQSSNLVARLTSLGYLETLKTTYSCVYMIIHYLHEGMSEAAIKSTDDFRILLDFINKIDRLLKLITQYVIYTGEELSQEFYEHTPTIIKHLEEILRSTLKVVDIIDDQLHIGVTQNFSAFQDWQMKLNEYLTRIHFPSTLLSQYELTDLVINLAPLYDEHRRAILSDNKSMIKRSSSFSSNTEPREVRKEMQQSRIHDAIIKLKNLLSHAARLPVRPHYLIQHIHTVVQKLTTFDLSHETENDYNWLISEEQRLVEQVGKFEREINQYTTFNVHLPRDEPIHRIEIDEISLNSSQTGLVTVDNRLKEITDIIHKSSEAHPLTELNQIVRLTHVQVSDQTWIHVMRLLKSSSDLEQLRNSLMVFRDDLAMDIERDPQKADANKIIIDKVTLAYSQFRCDLLIEESNKDMLINYTTVSRFSITLRQWMEKTHLNVFNIFETIKSISDDLNRAHNQMKNFSADASCSLLPVDLRPEDILSLFAPEYTIHVRMICDKFLEIDDFLAGRIDKVEQILSLPTTASIKCLSGLASLKYRDSIDPKKTYLLFDQTKDIDDIVREAMAVIQNLLNLCIEQDIREGLLMKSCTCVKELFPIQLSLSLILMILIDWTGTKLGHSFLYVDRLSMSTLKSLEDEIKTLQRNLYECRGELKQLERNQTKINDEYTNAEHEYQRVLHGSQFLAADKEKKVIDCQKRKTQIDEDIKNKQIDEKTITENLNKKQNLFDDQRKQEQQNWWSSLIDQFKEINIVVNGCFSSLLSISSSSDVTALLTAVVNIGRRHMIDPTNTSIDCTELEINREKIFQLLENLQNHAKKLMERDSMFSFLTFYCDVMRIGLRSLWQSISSWKIYSDALKTPSIQSYADQNKKTLVCKLANETSGQCNDFLNRVRCGYDQNEVIQLAQKIGRDIDEQVKSLDIALIGQYRQHLQNLLRDFQRFINSFLIAGCRYSQLQRGIREPLDDILGGIMNDDIDAHLPQTEIGLLELLETYENQIKSYTTTLIYQTLHLAFTFNSNPFGVLDKLDRSVKALIQLVLPAAHLLKQTWLTIDELVIKLVPNIVRDENETVTHLCQNFVQLTEVTSEIHQETEYLNMQLKSDRFQSIWEYLDRLIEILLQNRPMMKNFCENIMKRWHLTMKEIFQGFIKARKFHLHRQLEWNQQQLKTFGQLFSSNLTNEPFRLADIERALLHKNLLLNNIDAKERSKRWTQLQNLQVLYQLTIGGTDNLENTLMNMPIEQMDRFVFFKLVEMTSDIYDENSIILTEQPLTSFIYDENILKRSFVLLNRIHRLESDLYQKFFTQSKAPKATRLANALKLLNIREFDMVPPHRNIVDDNDPAINHNFSLTWTKSMQKAFSSGQNILVDLTAQIYPFIDRLRMYKTQLLLCYVWASTLSLTNISSDIQRSFANMLTESHELCQLSTTNNKESLKCLEQSRWNISNAQRLHRTIKRSTNNWMEVKHLQEISFTTIEDNLLTAFSHSQLGHDAHLWLMEVIEPNTNSITLTCHPKSAQVDFGITLSGIHQRL
ncbi:unnamed protein product, partial [Rotaria sp. Silwood1]